MATEATIEERGNGFPNVGDYVHGTDRLYRVITAGSRIETGAPGKPNWIHATVEAVDWDDCDEGSEFPARVVLGDADRRDDQEEYDRRRQARIDAEEDA